MRGRRFGDTTIIITTVLTKLLIYVVVYTFRDFCHGPCFVAEQFTRMLIITIIVVVIVIRKPGQKTFTKR